MKKDKVKVQAAAPIEQKIEVAPVKKKKVAQKIKVTPLVGLMAISGETENLESDLSIGIRGEADISPRVSVGMGIHYMSLSTNDFNNSNYYGDIYGGYGGYNSFYDVREIKYSNLNINIYSKFYFVEGNRFRPYIGGGLGYNRSTIKYQDNRSYDPYGSGYYGSNNYSFGNEEVNSSNLTGKLMAGAEVTFTDSIGLTMEVAYTRGTLFKF